MSGNPKPTDGSLLRRWSRLKTEAREKEKLTRLANAPAPASAIGEVGAPADGAGGEVGASPVAAQLRDPQLRDPQVRDRQLRHAQVCDSQLPARGNAAGAATAVSLPPVESLTIDSDFSAFMEPKVDEALKRRALKQLFRDPHFNVMDGLDVYIDDYSKPDPIAPEIVREMVQGRYIFNPPPTRIDALGNVEDVPEQEIAAMERAANGRSLPDTAEAGAVATASAASGDSVTSAEPSQSDATLNDPASSGPASHDPGSKNPASKDSPAR